MNVLDPTAPSGGGGRGGSLFDQIARNAAIAGAVNQSGATEVSTRVTLYRNGFTVDDGPLRDFTSPANASFLRAIEQGNVPEGKTALFNRQALTIVCPRRTAE